MKTEICSGHRTSLLDSTLTRTGDSWTNCALVQSKMSHWRVKLHISAKSLHKLVRSVFYSSTMSFACAQTKILNIFSGNNSSSKAVVNSCYCFGRLLSAHGNAQMEIKVAIVSEWMNEPLCCFLQALQQWTLHPPAFFFFNQSTFCKITDSFMSTSSWWISLKLVGLTCIVLIINSQHTFHLRQQAVCKSWQQHDSNYKTIGLAWQRSGCSTAAN